ncbi:MAG: hypothetical protein O3B95_03305 [Chloroflexi bacterium]|nr:hypothetical protein [Chloroflexota bacterium]
MPNFKRTLFFIAILSSLVLTAIACSIDSDSNSATIATGDYATCEDFVDRELVEELSGIKGLVDRVRVLDVASVDGFAESGATNNCHIEMFRTVDSNDQPAPGDSLAVSIVKFESSELALAVYHSTLAAVLLSAEQLGELAKIEQEVIGADSYLMDIEVGGIGAIVVYVSDSTFITLSSTSDDNGDALLDGRTLVTAAQSVQSRLP